MSQRTGFSLLVFLLAAALAQGAETASLPLLRLGYSGHDHHAPLYAAAEGAEELRALGRPYLRALKAREEYDLVWKGRAVARVKVARAPGGKELIRRLAEDQTDAAFGGFPALVAQIDSGAPLRVLAPVMTGGSGLVVRPDFPARSWDEFVREARRAARPVRIGYRADGAVQKLLFERALAEARLPVGSELDDPKARVVLVNLFEEGNLLSSLRDGLVDGFVGVQPYVAMAEEQKAGRVLGTFEKLPGGLCAPRPGRDPCDVPCCAVGVRESFLRGQPEAARALAALVAGAAELIRSQPARAAAWAAAWLGTPEAVERRSLPAIRFLSVRDAAWDAGAEGWVGEMVSRGTLKGRVAEAFRRGLLDRALYAGLSAGEGR